jgi:hypothetical protein
MRFRRRRLTLEALESLFGDWLLIVTRGLSSFVAFPVKTVTSLNDASWTRIESKPTSQRHIRFKMMLFNVFRAVFAINREVLGTGAPTTHALTNQPPLTIIHSLG